MQLAPHARFTLDVGWGMLVAMPRTPAAPTGTCTGTGTGTRTHQARRQSKSEGDSKGHTVHMTAPEGSWRATRDTSIMHSNTQWGDTRAAGSKHKHAMRDARRHETQLRWAGVHLQRGRACPAARVPASRGQEGPRAHRAASNLGAGRLYTCGSHTPNTQSIACRRCARAQHPSSGCSPPPERGAFIATMTHIPRAHNNNQYTDLYSLKGRSARGTRALQEQWA
jgi:hypothetical protein